MSDDFLTLLAHKHIDLRGCEYRESEQLTHIDGFLVVYNGHGRLTLGAHLSPSRKLTGVQHLLDQLQPGATPQLYMWQSAADTADPTALLTSFNAARPNSIALLSLPHSFVHTAALCHI